MCRPSCNFSTGGSDLSAACNEGNADACLALARERHEAGAYLESLEYTARACKAGNASACVHAATALEQGEGIEPNVKKAAAFYKAACKLGDDAACEAFARLRSKRDGPSSEAPEADSSAASLK